MASGAAGTTIQLEFRMETGDGATPRLEVFRNGEAIDLQPVVDGAEIRIEAQCDETGVWLYWLRAEREIRTAGADHPMVVFCGSPKEEIFTGEYVAAVADNFHRQRSRTLHFLKTGSGFLRILGLPDGAEAAFVPNSEVRFTGYRSGNAIILASGSGDLPSLVDLRKRVQHLRGVSTPRQPITGRAKVAVVLVRYSDTRDWPLWRETIHADVLSRVSGAYQEWSFGQLPLDFDYMGAFTLPARSPIPCAADTIIEAHLVISGRRYLEELGLNLSGYRNVLFLAYNNGGVLECGQGESVSGIAFFGGDATVFTTRMPRDEIVATAAHELGHSILILGHANRQSCSNQQAFAASRCTQVEYGNLADVMGQGEGHVGGAAKSVLGWLKPIEVTKSGVYEVAPLESKTSQPQVLKLDSAYLEYRRAIGFDKLIPASYQGVLVNVAAPLETPVLNFNQWQESWTIDPLLLSPFSGEGVPSYQRDKPAIQPGSCLQDPKSRYSVCTLEAGETAAKISALVPTTDGVQMALVNRPKEGEVVQGKVRVSGHALDAAGVKSVELLRGAEVLASAASGVFDFEWTPPADKPGTLGLTVRATGVGGKTVEIPLTILVPTPPSVRLIAPAVGATLAVGGPITLEAEVEGKESAIRSASFVISSGSRIEAAAGQNGRYGGVWKPTAAGAYEIHVEVTDVRGVRGASAPVRVTCTLAPQPTVSILAPLAATAYELGEPVPIAVRATASETTQIVSLTPEIFTPGEDGLYLGAWTPEQTGKHKLKVSVADNLGQAASAEVEVTVVEPGAARLRIQSPPPGASYQVGVESELKASIVSRGAAIDQATIYANGALAGKAAREAETDLWVFRWTPETAGEVELIALLTLADGSQVVTNVEALRVLPQASDSGRGME